MTFLKVFADVTRQNEAPLDCQSVTGVLTRRGAFGHGAVREEQHTGGGHVQTEAETERAATSQATEGRPHEKQDAARQGPPFEPPKGACPRAHLAFRPRPRAVWESTLLF